MANTLSNSKNYIIKQNWTLEEIIGTSSKSIESEPIYNLLRPIAYRLSWVFLRWNVAPNTITFAFIGCLVLASVVLALRPMDGGPIVGLLIIMSYILDICDGQVARAAKRYSSIGDKIDLLGHWVTNNLLILGATLGQIGLGAGQIVWLIGMIAMLGTNSYYYMQHTLMPYSPLSPDANKKTGSIDEQNQTGNKSILRHIRNLLHVFAPLDTNLLAALSLVGLSFLAIQIWAIISNVATFVIFGQYYWRETHQL